MLFYLLLDTYGTMGQIPVFSIGVDVNVDSAEETINRAINEANRIKTDALNHGSYIAAQKLETVILHLEFLRKALNNDVIKIIDKLDHKVQNYFLNIDKMVNDLLKDSESLMSDFDLVAQSNVMNLCNSLPNLICKDIAGTVSYIDGKVVANISPVHELTIGGTVFNVANPKDLIIKLEFDTTTFNIKVKQLPSSTPNKTAVFQLEGLEPYFDDTNYVYVPFELKVDHVKWKKNKREIKRKIASTSLPNSLLLLPRYPFKYNFTCKTTSEDCTPDLSQKSARRHEILLPVPVQSTTPTYSHTPFKWNIPTGYSYIGINLILPRPKGRYIHFGPITSHWYGPDQNCVVQTYHGGEVYWEYAGVPLSSNTFEGSITVMNGYIPLCTNINYETHIRRYWFCPSRLCNIRALIEITIAPIICNQAYSSHTLRFSENENYLQIGLNRAEKPRGCSEESLELMPTISNFSKKYPVLVLDSSHKIQKYGHWVIELSEHNTKYSLNLKIR